MKINRIDHIAVAVRSVDDVLKLYRDVLGFELVKVEDVEEEKVKIAMFRVGETFIELLEPKTPDSAVAKFINERGEGIHHVALRVENIDEALKEVASKGLRVIYSTSRNLEDRRINFIHPRDTHGVMIELIERLVEL